MFNSIKRVSTAVETKKASQKLSFVSRILFCATAISSLVGCQNELDNKQYLNIKLIGALTAPDTATGTDDPISQDYTIEGIFLSPDPDTNEAIALYTDDPKTFTVIERSQIVYKREIESTWVAESFDSLVVRFNSEVKGLSKYTDDYTINLSAETTTDVGYYTAFTVEKGQGIDAVIQVQWKDTVTVDPDDQSITTMQVPSFDVSITLN